MIENQGDEKIASQISSNECDIPDVVNNLIMELDNLKSQISAVQQVIKKYATIH